jgi:hypothetical protein
MICIDKKLLGTPKNLMWSESEESFMWVDVIPENSWVYSDNDYDHIMCLSTALRIIGEETFRIFPARHYKSLREVGVQEGQFVSWPGLISREEFRHALQSAVRRLQKGLETFRLTKYDQTYISNRKVLLGLSPTHIDIDRLEAHLDIETNPTVKGSIGSFAPVDEKSARPVSYDMVGTQTGRLTVRTGPQILTLPARCRDIMRSRYTAGKVIQLDFVSLEPRVAKVISGGQVEDDLYRDIGDRLFGGSVKRSCVKLAVLCAMYGVSTARLAKMLPENFNARITVKKIKEYFQIVQVVQKLIHEARDRGGSITNLYGRPISVDDFAENILYSHFIQSTAADTALVGFGSFLEELKTAPGNCVSLYTIHDALLLDVDEKMLSHLENRVPLGINVGSLGNFPVKISNVSACGT